MMEVEKSAVDVCARALREQIVSGELAPGVRLPPERELAERFAVGRVTVRGALAQLEAEHLVSVRQGSGYTVRAWRRTGGPDLIATLATLATTTKDRASIVGDLLLVRRQLARALLERLAEQRADDAAIAAVDRAVDRLAAAVERKAGVGELARADLEVAGAVVDASGSAVLALCFNPVSSMLVALPRLQDAMFRDPATNVMAWRVLAAWLRGNKRAGLDLIMEQLAERDEQTLKALKRGQR